MRVSVVFRNTPVLVPVGDGRMKISELIEMAITRYKRTDSRLQEYTITVRSLRLVDGGSFVDLDDEVADVLDDKEAVLADFDLIGDSLSTSSQESGTLLPSMAPVGGRVKPQHQQQMAAAHSGQSDGNSNLLSVSSTSNPSLVDHDETMLSSDLSSWTPSSSSAAMLTENDIHDMLWRHDQRAVPNSADRSNRTASFSSSQSERFVPSESAHNSSSSTAREMAVDGPLRTSRSSYTEALSEGRLRLPLNDARSRNSYAGPGIYERERRYEEPYSRQHVRKPYHPMDQMPPVDYIRYRMRSGGYHANSRSTENFQQRMSMMPRHNSSTVLQSRLAEDSTAYQPRYEEPGVDYFLSQPPYFNERHANEPSGYALSQPAHTFRSGRPSVVHAADLDPNSEAPHLRHLSQDDHSSRSDTPTYRTSPVPHGMRLDAATYHGNRMLRFSDNEEDNCSTTSDIAADDSNKLPSSSPNKYNPFQRNRRFSIQRDGLVFARWAEYCENVGIPESDEDRDTESVRHIATYQSPSSSHEELSSYRGNSSSMRSGRHVRVTSSPANQDNERGRASTTESESEDDLGNIHIIELHKGSHDLGIKIKKCTADNKDQGIFVDGMEAEGFATVSQKLQINDRILACNGCDFTKLSNQKAEAMFKEMMDEPLLRMAISRGNQLLSGEGSDVSDHHHGDGDSTVDGSDPGYNVTNTREIGVIHEIKVVKGAQGLGFGITTRDVSATSGSLSQPIYIKSISRDGPAFKDGKLKLGDRLLKVNNMSTEGMNQPQVVQLMRSLPLRSVTLQVSRQETHPSGESDAPPTESTNETAGSNVGVASGRTVMTFDITMHQSDPASLGVTVHGRTRLNSPSHSSKNADVGIYIKSIVPGGLAAMDGRVQQGDQVLCINGHNLLGKSNSEAMEVLKNALSQLVPGTSTIQLVISRKTAAAPPTKFSATPTVSDENSQSHEVGIDVGNAAITTPNSQGSQSSAGIVIETSEHLSSRKRNESEPPTKYGETYLPPGGSPYQHHRLPHSNLLERHKPPVQRSSSESRYESYHHNQPDFTSHNSSSSGGSGLVSPTGVTLSLSGHHESSQSAGHRSVNRHDIHDRHGNHDVFTSSTPIHMSGKSHVDYPSYSLPRPGKSSSKKVMSPTSSQLDSAGSDTELAGPYFRRDAPGRISIKKGKQAPQRDFSQFSFRNSEPKVEGDDSSSIATELIRTGSAESILTSRSPIQYNVKVGPKLGLAKSSSLESLQTILAAQRMSEDELVMRGRETRSSFRKAVDKTYDSKRDDLISDETDHEIGPFDRSLMSYTKNPKNKVKRKGFLKSLFRKGKNKRLSSLDHHGDIMLPSDTNQMEFDPTPPARVELRPHLHGNSSKMYQRYSMSVLDNMEFEDDDITATIADV